MNAENQTLETENFEFSEVEDVEWVESERFPDERYPTMYGMSWNNSVKEVDNGSSVLGNGDESAKGDNDGSCEDRRDHVNNKLSSNEVGSDDVRGLGGESVVGDGRGDGESSIERRDDIQESNDVGSVGSEGSVPVKSEIRTNVPSNQKRKLRSRYVDWYL